MTVIQSQRSWLFKVAICSMAFYICQLSSAIADCSSELAPNSHVVNNLPDAKPRPEYSSSILFRRDGNPTSIIQEEVLIGAYPEETRAKIDGLMELASDGYALKFVEAGFFVIYTKTGALLYSPICTSNNPNKIFRHDLDNALDALLKSSPIGLEDIARLQFFHTHPGHDPLARLISSGDLSLAEDLATLYPAIPIDMHAIPYDFATGMIESVVPGPVKPKPIAPRGIRSMLKRLQHVDAFPPKRGRMPPIQINTTKFKPFLLRATVIRK